MKAYLDIENSKTQKVITICVDVLKYELDKEIIFDIAHLNNKELKLLEDAIDEKLTHTDIEIFFIDNNKTPIFGPDYTYKLIDNKMIALFKRKETNSKTIRDNLEYINSYFEE